METNKSRHILTILAFTLLLILGFWWISRYPALNSKAAMSGMDAFEDPLTHQPHFSVPLKGSLSLRVEVSPWLILCAFLIALFLVLNKRKSELLLQNQTNSNFRSVLTDYSLENVKLMVSITSACLIMTYSLYTFFVMDRLMMFSILFVIFGIFRYLELISENKTIDRPERLILDKQLLINGILWVLFVCYILYLE